MALFQYGLEAVRQSWSREWLAHAPPTQWRYAPLLPVDELASVVSLGEGMTPLLRLERMGAALGLDQLWLKDEAPNPGGAVSARAASCWFTVARTFGVTEALLLSAVPYEYVFALYAARSGIRLRIQDHRDSSQLAWLICAMSGAVHFNSPPTNIDDQPPTEVDNRSAYLLEGLKTLGFELAEQLRWSLPDAVLVPEGDGNLTIAIWKAFKELAAIEWVQNKSPRFYAVQSRGCCPLVQALNDGLPACKPCPDPKAIGAWFRVPKPLHDKLLLRIVRESGGAALAVDDQEMIDAGVELAHLEGVFASLEGAAALCAVRQLVLAGQLRRGEVVVLVNPGSGHWSSDVYATRFPRYRTTEFRKHGGLILPR